MNRSLRLVARSLRIWDKAATERLYIVSVSYTQWTSYCYLIASDFDVTPLVFLLHQNDECGEFFPLADSHDTPKK